MSKKNINLKHRVSSYNKAFSLYQGRFENQDFFDHYHKFMGIKGTEKFFNVYGFKGFKNSILEIVECNIFFYKKTKFNFIKITYPYKAFFRRSKNKKQLKVSKYSLFRNYIQNWAFFGRDIKHYENYLKIEFLIHTKSIYPINYLYVDDIFEGLVSYFSLKKKTFDFLLKYGPKLKRTSLYTNVDNSLVSYDRSTGFWLISEFFDINLTEVDSFSGLLNNYFTENLVDVFYLYESKTDLLVISTIFDFKKSITSKQEIKFDDTSTSVFDFDVYYYFINLLVFWNKFFLIEYYKLMITTTLTILNMLIKDYINTKIRRNNTKLHLFLFKTVNFRYFSFSGLNFFSKTVNKHRSLRSKKKKSINIFWNYHKTTNYYKSLSIVLYIFFSLKLYKFIMIIKNSSGLVCSKLATTNRNLFSYFFFRLKPLKESLSFARVLALRSLNKLDFESFVCLLKRRSFVNCVELFFKKGHQYARSTGSKARLLDVDKKSQTIQIELPSKEIKIFDMYSTCNKNPLLLLDKRKLLFDTKRYKRLSGFGPLVRGVAMNAIDHPHGGKTKSIKYPKTPWGLTTKFK